VRISIRILADRNSPKIGCGQTKEKKVDDGPNPKKRDYDRTNPELEKGQLRLEQRIHWDLAFRADPIPDLPSKQK
jgi:hypothetical protein